MSFLGTLQGEAVDWRQEVFFSPRAFFAATRIDDAKINHYER
jgi:hypothetical protein